MVVEHTFITTLDPEKAMGLASSFLGKYGFIAKAQTAFQVDSAQWNHVEMSRGKPRTLNPVLCQQNVRVEFDRGRITVAAQINPSFNSRRSIEPRPASKKGKKYAQLMIALSQALDDLVAKGVDPDTAAQPWKQLESAFAKEYNRQMKIERTIKWIVLAAVVVAVGYIIYIISRGP